MNTVLMTGITGFLGSQIARKLAQRADVTIYAVVRPAQIVGRTESNSED